VRADPGTGGVSTTSQNRIAVVIDYMEDLHTTIMDQEREEAVNYKCLMEWCASEIKVTGQEIKQVEMALDDKGASIKEVDADIAKYTQMIKENQEETTEVSDSVEQANNIRTEESDKYEQDKSLNDQSVRQVKEAVKIVGQVHESGGFLQNGVLRRVKANEPGESNFVLGIMKQLSDKLVATGQEMKHTEFDKRLEHKDFMDLKAKQSDLLHKDTVARQLKLNEDKVDKAELEHEVEDLVEEAESYKARLQKDMSHCEKKKEEWHVRGEDRAAERSALREAIDFLNKTMQDELQTSLLQESTEEAEPALAKRADTLQSPSFLQVGSMKASAQSKPPMAALLDEVESRTQKQGYEEARKVVKDLIVTLQNQQEDETAKMKLCKKEIDARSDEKAVAEDKVEQLEASIKQKDTKVDTLTDETIELEGQIDEAKTALATATEIRNKEKSVYEAGTKDRNLALKVMDKAQKVMGDFYQTADGTKQHDDQAPTLLQSNQTDSKQAPPPTVPPGRRVPKSWYGSSRHQLEGQNIMKLLAKIGDDIRLEQKDADMAENEAVTAYTQLKEETIASIEKQTQEIRDRVTLRAKLRVQVADLSDKKEATEDDIKSFLEQLNALRTECDELLKNYEQRLKARSFEIQQLRDTRDVLAGSSVAVRTD